MSHLQIGSIQHLYPHHSHAMALPGQGYPAVWHVPALSNTMHVPPTSSSTYPLGRMMHANSSSSVGVSMEGLELYLGQQYQRMFPFVPQQTQMRQPGLQTLSLTQALQSLPITENAEVGLLSALPSKLTSNRFQPNTKSLLHFVNNNIDCS